MFSVIIPLYNKEASISETIQSVLNQTFKDFELVIVNDGSTDNSPEIAQQIKDERIRLIHQKNKGVSSARNNGIRNAKYEWIAFLDADDKWSDNFLEEIHKAIKDCPEEKIFVGGQRIYYHHKSERYNNPHLPDEDKTDIVNYYLVISKYNPPMHSSNVVIKKEMFDKFGYFLEGQKNFEDHNLWMRLCVENNLVYINKELSLHWKDDPNSASKGGFRAIDFVTMIKTYKEVEQKLSDKNKAYFKKYYNRFITFSLIKNRARFDKNEIASIKKAYKDLCSTDKVILNDLIVMMNIKSLHSLLRPFRKLFIKNAV